MTCVDTFPEYTSEKANVHSTSALAIVVARKSEHILTYQVYESAPYTLETQFQQEEQMHSISNRVNKAEFIDLMNC